MTRGAAILPLLAALAIGCERSTIERDSATRDRAADSTIYSILLDTLRGACDSVFVARELPELWQDGAGEAAVAGWAHERRPGVDSALVVALLMSRYSASLPTILGSPGGVRWFSKPREIEEPGPFRKYPVLSFGRVVFDSTRTHAVTYAAMSCGGLCGNGSIYAFERRHGAWVLVDQVVLMIS